MAGEQDVVQLPFKVTEINEDMLVALHRNFKEIERHLSFLQMQVKFATGGGVGSLKDAAKIWDRAGVITEDGTFLTDRLEGLIQELQIADAAISELKIKDLAVNSAKLAENAVLMEKIADGAVDTDKLAANAVIAEKINAGAVTSEKINAGAVTAEKIGAREVTAEKMNVDKLSAISSNMGHITAGTIAAGAVTVGSDVDYDWAGDPTKPEGIGVVDSSMTLRALLGSWLKASTRKHGLKIVADDGSTVILDEEGIMQTWQDSWVDNVDATHALVLNIYLPAETKSIHKAILRFRLQRFRAHETGATSGGGSTVTSSSGGDSTVTSDNKTVTVSTFENTGGTDYWTDANSYRFVSGWTGDNTGNSGEHNHGISNGTKLAKDGGGYITWAESGNHNHPLYNHGHRVVVPNHTHQVTLNAHNHYVSIGSHSHNVYLPDHSHGIVYGIYESTFATSVTVKINGTNRTSELGGGSGFAGDQSNLDVSSYLLTGQWNAIELGSSQLGRIDASIFIQAKMGV